MIVTAKYKICKRLGSGIFEKCQTQKFTLSEARSGRKRTGRRGGISDYGRQLLEKQKARYLYGISEKQFHRYVHTVVSQGGDAVTGNLISSLESRLDNVVYRLGLAPTRRMARQMVSHGHILVNGRRVSIPSYETKAGETIAVRPGSRALGPFLNLAERMSERSLPQWLSFDITSYEGKITGSPTIGSGESIFDPSAVIEFYSR